MDAVFYNESGDRYYSGKQFVFNLTSSGAVTGQVVPFKFMQISETDAVLSWRNFEFIATADDFLVFENVPVQFLGSGARDYFGTYVLVNTSEGVTESYFIGMIHLDVANSRLLFYIGRTEVVELIEVLAKFNFVNAEPYKIFGGSITFERVFE
jgi:hypothetical protein